MDPLRRKQILSDWGTKQDNPAANFTGQTGTSELVFQRKGKSVYYTLKCRIYVCLILEVHENTKQINIEMNLMNCKQMSIDVVGSHLFKSYIQCIYIYTVYTLYIWNVLHKIVMPRPTRTKILL